MSIVQKNRFQISLVKLFFPICVLFFLSSAHAASETRNANNWSVNNNADWTPFPPNSAPLGAPDTSCTGGTNPSGGWATFSFPAFAIPVVNTVTGIQLRLKYLSASGSNTVQLTNGGSTIGSSKSSASVGGSSSCSSTSFTSVAGDGDLWGTALTAADFNAGTVGFRLTQNVNTVDLDAVELIVFHEDQTVIIEADLAVSKDDGLDIVNQGGQTIYTIVVSNSGPDDVTAATVSDNFPASLSCSWTCVASAGSSCTAAGSGDISDTVDLENGDNATYSAACTVAGDATGSLLNTATVTVPDGVVDPNVNNNSHTDTTAVNQRPVALCKDVIVEADPGNCTADADIDDGSFDPDDDPFVLEQNPPGPYSLGDTAVELTITDDGELSDNCNAMVTVVDVTSPEIQCNAPATIIPPDAPVSFASTATDACGAAATEITSYDCYKFTKKGKRIDKTASCVLGIAENSVTISDSGGVGTYIEWSVLATDGSGNTATDTCLLEVVSPGRR